MGKAARESSLVARREYARPSFVALVNARLDQRHLSRSTGLLTVDQQVHMKVQQSIHTNVRIYFSYVSWGHVKWYDVAVDYHVGAGA